MLLCYLQSYFMFLYTVLKHNFINFILSTTYAFIRQICFYAFTRALLIILGFAIASSLWWCFSLMSFCPLITQLFFCVMALAYFLCWICISFTSHHLSSFLLAKQVVILALAISHLITLVTDSGPIRIVCDDFIEDTYSIINKFYNMNFILGLLQDYYPIE